MVNIAETDVSLTRHVTLPSRRPSSEFRFRLAHVVDLPELARLRMEQLGANRHGNSQSESDFCDSFKAFLLDRIASSEWLVLVAEINGQLAGCVFLQKIARLPRPGLLKREYGSITNLFVRKQYCGQGLRSRLLHAMAQIARSEDFEFLIGRAKGGSRSIYRELGFRANDLEMELDLK